MPDSNLTALPSSCLLVDEVRMKRNIAQLARHQRYHVVPQEPGARQIEWPRFGGW